jgi:DNA-binding response OmpR family regulator
VRLARLESHPTGRPEDDRRLKALPHPWFADDRPASAHVLHFPTVESLMLGPLIVMVRRSIGLTLIMSVADAARGEPRWHAVAGLHSSGSRWNVAGSHQILDRPTEGLAPGRVELDHRGEPAAQGAGSQADSQQQSHSSPPTPGRLPAESKVLPTNRAPRIMVVDDEPHIRLMSRMTLETGGYEVVEAEDGEAAIDFLRGSPVDLILLDLRMPLLDGMETLRDLREAGDDTPVVIVTAHGSVPDAVEAMKLGAIDFLSKPLAPEAMRRVVSEVIGRHAPDSPGTGMDDAGRPTVAVVARSVLDLTAVKATLNRREFERAADLLERALDAAPDNAEAHTLMGILLECRGQCHAAYHSYRKALAVDPLYSPARENLRHYCARLGLDPDSPRINPAAGR